MSETSAIGLFRSPKHLCIKDEPTFRGSIQRLGIPKTEEPSEIFVASRQSNEELYEKNKMALSELVLAQILVKEIFAPVKIDPVSGKGLPIKISALSQTELKNLSRQQGELKKKLGLKDPEKVDIPKEALGYLKYTMGNYDEAIKKYSGIDRDTVHKAQIRKPVLKKLIEMFD